jgi:hypothetical protein
MPDMRTPGTLRVSRIIIQSKPLIDEEIGNLEVQEDFTNVKRALGLLVSAVAHDLSVGSPLRTQEVSQTYSKELAKVDLVTFKGFVEFIIMLIQNVGDPSNVFERSSDKTYESLSNSKVTITLKLPGPCLYVGYRLLQSNLRTWKIEAQETPGLNWTVIDTQQDVDTVTDTTEPSSVLNNLETRKARKSYGTTAVKGYSFYRITMLKSNENTFKVGSLEFMEMQLPNVLVDGPNSEQGLNTVIGGFEIEDPGAGYVGNVTVQITPTISTILPQEPAEAEATIDTTGKVTQVVLKKRK